MPRRRKGRRNDNPQTTQQNPTSLPNAPTENLPAAQGKVDVTTAAGQTFQSTIPSPFHHPSPASYGAWQLEPQSENPWEVHTSNGSSVRAMSTESHVDTGDGFQVVGRRTRASRTSYPRSYQTLESDTPSFSASAQASHMLYPMDTGPYRTLESDTPSSSTRARASGGTGLYLSRESDASSTWESIISRYVRVNQQIPAIPAIPALPALPALPVVISQHPGLSNNSGGFHDRWASVGLSRRSTLGRLMDEDGHTSAGDSESDVHLGFSPDASSWPSLPGVSSSPTRANSVSAADQEPPPPSPDLRKLAEDASVLLELFSKTDPGDKEDENQELIESAFKSITKIRNQYRIMTAQQNDNPGGSGIPQEQMDDMKVDSACVICYGQISDTVLIPCSHLVLCTACCDTVGIKGKENSWGKNISCPICRRNVTDRMKIFRG